MTGIGWETFWQEYDVLGDKLPRGIYFLLLLGQKILKRPLFGSRFRLCDVTALIGRVREVTNLVACAEDFGEASSIDLGAINCKAQELSKVLSLGYSIITVPSTLASWGGLTSRVPLWLLVPLADTMFAGKHALMLWSELGSASRSGEGKAKDQKSLDALGSFLELLDAIGEGFNGNALSSPAYVGVGLSSAAFGICRSWPEERDTRGTKAVCKR